ncbi:MAG: hypothetical protein HZB41_04870 [Ignavibacteriae bacterium]|nr:hypothetical protein [Ignavibacteriota bacterium]
MYLINSVRLFIVLLALFTLSCSETPTTDNSEQEPIRTSIESPCGEQYFNLYIEQSILAGRIRVANDLDSLYITYYLDDPYLAEPQEMHLWFGYNAPTKKGTPKQYPYSSINSDYVNIYSFTLALSELQQYMNNGTFYFMTYVSVVTPRDGGRYSNPVDGFSEVIVKTKSKGAWYGYNSYSLRDCGAQ